MSGPKENELMLEVDLNAWLIMIALSLASLVFFPLEVTKGVFVGGLLVAVNLHFLRRAVVKTLTPGGRVRPNRMLVKYYLRFVATGLVIFLLLSEQLVDAFGLLLGLSAFIINTFLVIMHQTGKIIYKLITKEAV